MSTTVPMNEKDNHTLDQTRNQHHPDSANLAAYHVAQRNLATDGIEDWEVVDSGSSSPTIVSLKTGSARSSQVQSPAASPKASGHTSPFQSLRNSSFAHVQTRSPIRGFHVYGLASDIIKFRETSMIYTSKATHTPETDSMTPKTMESPGSEQSIASSMLVCSPDGRMCCMGQWDPIELSRLIDHLILSKQHASFVLERGNSTVVEETVHVTWRDEIELFKPQFLQDWLPLVEKMKRGQ